MAAAGAQSVSFPAFPVPAGERIVGFELVVTGGRFSGIESIPKDWSLKLDADDPTRQTLSGTIPRAPEGLQPTSALPTFVTAAAEQRAGSRPFDLEGVVYTSADSKTYVRHRFRCDQLVRKERAP